MKCVVTGGAGFIGSHVTLDLIKRGFDAVIYDNNIETIAPILNNTATLVSGDVRDVHLLRRTIDGADCVFHLSGILGTSELFDTPYEAIDINLKGALNVLMACMTQRNAPRIFFPTKPNHWHNIYSMTAQAVEKLGQAYRENFGLDVRMLRIPTVYGPGQRVYPVKKAVPQFVTNALRDRPLEIFGERTKTIQLVYIEDLANLISNFMLQKQNQPDVFEIIPSANINLKNLALLVIEMTNSKSYIAYLPQRRGESPKTPAPTGRDLREIVGNMHETDIEVGMQNTIDWYKLFLSEL